MMLHPPCNTVGMLPGFLDVTLGIQAKEFNLGFIIPENLVSHGLRVLQVSFGKLDCHMPFIEEWLPSGYSTIKGLIG
jgi:hypothetical protein